MSRYVNEAGSDRQDDSLKNWQKREYFQESSGKTTRESSTAGWRSWRWTANICLRLGRSPQEFAQSDRDVRAWRLPSGRLVITDLERQPGPDRYTTAFLRNVSITERVPRNSLSYGATGRRQQV